MSSGVTSASVSMCWGGGPQELLGLADLVRRARGSGSREQRHRGRGFDQGGVQDDGKGHGRDSHLQGRRQWLQDERRLTGGGGARGRHRDGG